MNNHAITCVLLPYPQRWRTLGCEKLQLVPTLVLLRKTGPPFSPSLLCTQEVPLVVLRLRPSCLGFAVRLKGAPESFPSRPIRLCDT